MRLPIALGLTCAALVACGCSSAKMPSFIPTFGKAKNKAPDNSNLTNAPPAPQLNSMSSSSPNVSMPPSGTSWSNLPVYPGTSYQQTPYPAPAVAQAQPAPYADPAAAAAATYAATYGTMPPAADAAAATPYASYPPSAAAAPYAPPQAPAYGQQASTTAAPSYAPQQASYPPQQPAAAQPPAYAQQAPYGGQPPAYPPQDPYGAAPPAQPYNAANPYPAGTTPGTYTR